MLFYIRTFLWPNGRVLCFLRYEALLNHPDGSLDIDIQTARAALQFQFDSHPNLAVRVSSLGSSVGLGLFASAPIKAHTKNKKPKVLCFYWGTLVMASDEEIKAGQADFFYGCIHNAIQFDKRLLLLFFNASDFIFLINFVIF